MSKPNTYILPSVYLLPVISVCAEKFIDLKRILMNVGLSPSLLQSATQPMDYLTYTKVLNDAARISGDPLFGFLVGKQLSGENVGALGYLITAQTCIADIYPVITYLFNTEHRGTRHDLIVKGNVASHEVTYFLEQQIDCTQVSQLTLMGYFNVFKNSLGNAWQPTRILMKTASNINTTRMEKFCGCPVETGADKNAIEFPSKLVYQEIDKTEFHSREARKQLAKILMECEDLEKLVANFIDFSLANKTYEKTHIAKRLGIHPRVFQQCLHDKGLEYKNILQKVRENKACRLLASTNNPVTDIALQLGYAEPRVFSSAFKKWLGVTPLKYRKSQ